MNYADGIERGIEMSEPTFSAHPMPNMGRVSLSVWLWRGTASATMTPNDARMLAIHLARAADEAEAAEQADLVDAARCTVACVEPD